MPDKIDAQALLQQLDELIERASDLEVRFADALDQVQPQFRASARNLVHYIAMRRADVQALQQQLAWLGLSSLGRAESHVMPSLNAVRGALREIAGADGHELGAEREEFLDSDARLARHVTDALGPASEGRDTRIMVTLPSEAAERPSLVEDLIAAGMNIARINSGHDNVEVWQRMVENIRAAERATGRSCRVAIDLAGPKLRTGALQPGPGIVRLRPRRDVEGKVVAPGRVRFVSEQDFPRFKKWPAIPVPDACIEQARVGDQVRFNDMRGKKRTLRVVRKGGKSLVLDCYKGAYIRSGTPLTLVQAATGDKADYRVGQLPATDIPIVVNIGDTLIIHADPSPGAPAELGADGSVIEPAHIACRQHEVFRFVSDGDPIRLNDGKIEGVVTSANADRLVIEITAAKARGSRLRGDRGINFPGSDIRLRGLTEADRANLDFVVEHADAVCLSFVRKPVDIAALQAALKDRDAADIGIIIKIETMKAFKDLPRLLLMAMRQYPAAVMIARGDLAVECGWERLAEIQEEILWMCEAAHMPVIWATQVLEHKAKSGRPSRAEVTDAAMSQRADCVMLNKGPFIVATVQMLDNIIRRMQRHQHKKSPKLRKLSITDV